MNAYWNNGMRLESDDTAFKIQFGGRILNDWGSVSADQDIEDAFDAQTLEGTGTKMRHARLYMSGFIYNHYTFKADYDFAGTDADFKDVWMGVKNIPRLGELRVGHQKEPFSLETMNSLTNTTFMERGLQTAFVPGRNTGVKIHNSSFGNRLGWGIGAYKDVDDSGDGFDDQSDYNVTGRLTGVPFTNEDGSCLLHLGMAYSHKFCDEDESIKYRSRPESNLSDVYTVDTGSINGVTGVDLLGPEIAFVNGSFCFQSEYVHTYLNRTSADNLDFSGYYALCSFFLTGEQRVYKIDDGGGEFGQVIPNQPFAFDASGWGAWQMALRYSAIDLNSRDIQGGQEKDYTFGINWFLNPNLRMTFNYVLANIDDRHTIINGTTIAIDDDYLDIYMMRFQVDF
jgi:phosphate-selective porin OprO/OprP